jgi:hypothetical protein
MLGENLPLRHLTRNHHKFHMNWFRNKPGPQQQENSAYLPQLWRCP